MKKLLLLACMVLLLTACGKEKEPDNTEAENIISTLDYANTGKMGDVDGPAFAVYSQIGYTGASVVLDVADMEINTVFPNGKFVNGYSFLGIDVYHDSDGNFWNNCIDAGLCWAGKEGGWHVFYNMYEPLNQKTPTWYESSVILPKDDVYTMTLKITEDNYALLTVEGQTNGVKDEVRIEVKGARANGSRTSFLFNTALDYPPNTKIGQNGKFVDDFVDITLANSDKGIYLRSVHATELTLYQNETAIEWTNDKCTAISIWPDKNIEEFDYSPTVVETFDGTEYIIDLDMNRK